MHSITPIQNGGGGGEGCPSPRRKRDGPDRIPSFPMRNTTVKYLNSSAARTQVFISRKIRGWCGGGDFFSGALRLSVTTPRQPFGLSSGFSTFHYLYFWYLQYCKNTKIMEVHNYSCILPYSMIYRTGFQYLIWMVAPQERKVVFHEHSLRIVLV